MRLNDTSNEAFLTPEELSRRLKLSAATIYKLLAQGELPYFKVGKCYRIPEQAFAAYMMQEGNLARFIKAPFQVPVAAQRFVELIDAAPDKVKRQIMAVVLFGSHARGEADKDSDIDLLVIVSTSDAALEGEISSLSSRAMADGGYDEFLSPIRMTLAHWKKSAAERSPLVEEIKREGVLLWSRGLKSLKDIEAAPKKS